MVFGGGRKREARLPLHDRVNLGSGVEAYGAREQETYSIRLLLCLLMDKLYLGLASHDVDVGFTVSVEQKFVISVAKTPR